MIRAGLLAALLCWLATGCASDDTLRQFRATLAAQDSATRALEQWCGVLGILVPPHIEAVQMNDAVATTPAIRAALAIGADAAVRVRHVHLTCGGVVLSDARNWYVPGRLTPAMNHTLDTTRTSFGTVVAPIGLHRQPLPRDTPSPAACPIGTIHHETAVLHANDGAAYALVSECYTRANLAGRVSE